MAALTDKRVEIQAALLERVREEIGPMVAASIPIERSLTHINLMPLRELSTKEMDAVKTIAEEFDVPVIIEPFKKPSRLAMQKAQPL